jgi:heme A synthase
VDIVRTIHGEVRWLVALIAIVVIVKFAVGLIQKSEYARVDKILMSSLVGLIDLNFLLGLILLISLGFDSRVRLEHAGTMFIAVLLAHSNAVWRKSEDSAKKFRNNLILVVVVLVLVFLGVTRLRGGFF